jgi:hypothetical protein
MSTPGGSGASSAETSVGAWSSASTLSSLTPSLAASGLPERPCSLALTIRERLATASALSFASAAGCSHSDCRICCDHGTRAVQHVTGSCGIAT